MRKTVCIGVACALLIAGCGGVAELDGGDTETVSLARQTVTESVAQGSLSPEGEQRLIDLIVLCREKPLSETGTEGQTMRELLTSLAPRLMDADPEFAGKMQKIARSGCD